MRESIIHFEKGLSGVSSVPSKDVSEMKENLQR